MGSPSNIDVITGTAKIPCGEISAKEWCDILYAALRKIQPCLKYVAGFKTLGQLLNGELLSGYGPFTTPTSAMPELKAPVSQKTRFVALNMSNSVQTGHEINREVLLLSDTGYFAILKLCCFKQTSRYVVCAASFASEPAKYYELENSAIHAGIKNKSISPYNVLDRLYLLFYGTIDDREKHLASMRQARDWLKQTCERIS